MSRNLANQRVLVVEDDYLIAENMRLELQAAGAEILGPVANVSEAIALIKTAGTIDAAVLDINLGGELVYPVAEILAKHGVRLVFTTGYDATAVPPAFAHIPRCEKPVSTEHILEALQKDAA